MLYHLQETFLEDSRQAAIESLLCGGSGPALARQSTNTGGTQAANTRGEAGDVLLWVGSWNSNGKVVSEADLTRWFTSVRDPCDTQATPDVYAVGFQVCL